MDIKELLQLQLQCRNFHEVFHELSRFPEHLPCSLGAAPQNYWKLNISSCPSQSRQRDPAGEEYSQHFPVYFRIISVQELCSWGRDSSLSPARVPKGPAGAQVRALGHFCPQVTEMLVWGWPQALLVPLCTAAVTGQDPKLCLLFQGSGFTKFWGILGDFSACCPAGSSYRKSQRKEEIPEHSQRPLVLFPVLPSLLLPCFPLQSCFQFTMIFPTTNLRFL